MMKIVLSREKAIIIIGISCNQYTLCHTQVKQYANLKFEARKGGNN